MPHKLRSDFSVHIKLQNVKQNTNQIEKSTKKEKSVFPHTGLSTQTKVHIYLDECIDLLWQVFIRVRSVRLVEHYGLASIQWNPSH